jgi:hypothetical protein
MTDTGDLARRVDAVVRGVDGVVELYASRPIVPRLVQTAVDPDAALSSVSSRDASHAVVVSVGVVDSDGSDATALRIARAIRAELNDDAAEVTVRISRIVPSRAG